MQEVLVLFFSGLILGIAGVMPGALGTVLAVSLGVYEPLIAIIAHSWQLGRKRWRFWLPLALGAVIGWTGFLSLVTRLWLQQSWQVYLLVVILGLVMGLLPDLYYRSMSNQLKLSHLCLATLGFVLYVGVDAVIVAQSTSLPQSLSIMAAFFSGLVFGIGGVVPGFSASLLLIGAGIFTPLLAAAADFKNYLPQFLTLVGGYLLAVLLGAKLVQRFLECCRTSIYYFFFGLTFACLWKIWPKFPLNNQGVILAIIFCSSLLGGYIFSRLNDFLDKT